MINNKWANSLLGNARSFIRSWRLPRWEVSGKERFSDLPISLVYFGHDFGFRTISQKIFAPGYTAKRTGSAWLGAPGFPLTPTNQAGDIVAIEIDPVRWRARDTGSGFLLPLWSRTSILVEDACRQMQTSSSLKDDLRRIRKNNIVCETAGNSRDLRTFYERMYMPYIAARHGELSLPDSWETIVETERCGELIFAKGADGEPIGGIVVGRNAENMYARSLGLISHEKELLKTGVMSALYLACFERARSYGYDRVGFGLTGSFLNDGLLRFKKKWGLQLVDECKQGIWLQFNNATPAVGSFLTNNPFIYRQDDKIHGATFVEGSELMDDESLRKLHSYYYLPGMESLHICPIKSDARQSPIPPALAGQLVWGTNRRLFAKAT
ncbi:MAG: hypothetical protein FD165_578 [Gammaproteobacteria bacterium]|nr:MAG: hypothetical protein FD165_578 [Gammaproteobacteria bacterium]TND02160.1 MAG: hypothetical protein FD120_2324 [Gammaproteobacteria bacterium]